MPSPVLTATATCLDGCGVLAEGDPATVDKAAAKHTEKPPKHATAVVAVPG
jgi:hypothetical protein